MNKVDRTGRVYGDLTVVAEVLRPGQKSWWRCVCACGNETVVSGGNLANGNTKSCGCRKHAAIDMVGKTFGRLTVAGRCVNPYGTGARWLCRCECGNEHRVVGSNLRSGSVASCGCLPRLGPDAGNWRGGKRRDTQGYVRVYAKGHPNASREGYIMEHRLVMSVQLGRPLYPDENVHHINGVRDDNRVENLELWAVSQPKGSRATDLLAWAQQIIERYGHER